MQKFIKYLTLATALVGIIGCGILLANVYSVQHKPLPMSYEAEQFKAFESAYLEAYDDYRLTKFEDSVKGEVVIFEGVVWDVSRTGVFFEMIPVNGRRSGKNNYPLMEANVFIEKGYVGRAIKPEGRVRVTGKIGSVGESGVFITAGKVEAL